MIEGVQKTDRKLQPYNVWYKNKIIFFAYTEEAANKVLDYHRNIRGRVVELLTQELVSKGESDDYKQS